MPTSLFRFAFVTAFLSLSTTLLTCNAAEYKQPEPLEPEVAEASDEAAESMGTIKVKDGWKIELYAAEPEVANVVTFDIDHRGRMFVCETYRQNRGVTDNRGHDEAWLLADLAAETVQDRIDYHKRLLGDAAVTYAQHDDRIRRLADTDGDGRIDDSTVLASGFNRIEEGTGAGVLVRGDSIYYTCIPKLWKLIDADDDGVADERIVLSDGYGVRVAFRGHDMHGLVIGPDGRLYFSIGDRGYHVTTDDGRTLADPQSGAVFRCELDGSKLEVFATGMRNPQELAFNDVGDLFSVDNNSDSGDKARVINILEGGDSGWRMQYQYLADRGPFNRDRVWEPFHNEQPAHIVPPIANFTDGPSGLAYYPGTGFGDSLKDNFLICDFRGGPANSGIRSFKLESDGAFYKMAGDSDPIWQVLATDVMFGPDGRLYVSDWVNGWDGLGMGRIYKITDTENHSNPIVAEVAALLPSDWSEKSSGKLIELLSHADRRVRFESQWELAGRGSVDSLIGKLSDESADTITRLHAIWGADHVARIDAGTKPAVIEAVAKLLASADPVIQAAAIKVLGERMTLADEGAGEKAETIRSLMLRENARVQYAAIRALGRMKDADSIGSVVAVLAQSNNADPALRHAGVMYLATAIAPESIAALAVHDSEAVRRAAVVALRRLRSRELTKFLKDKSPLVVLDAARAIHDAPVPVAMSALAALIDEPIANQELARRVLNANYRIGTPAEATKLAEFAGDVSADADMRIEALDMLASWANPDPRDRVVNAYRPLDPRAAKAAADGLAPQIDLLMSSQEKVREKAIEVASGLGINKIAPMLAARVTDDKQRSTIRASALTALARLDRKAAVKLAQSTPMMPANEVLTASLDVLAKYDAKPSIKKFVEATQSGSVDVRQKAWDILSGLNEPEAITTIIGGVESYLGGMLPADVHLNVLEAAAGKLDDATRERLIEHGRSLAESDSLGTWLASLEGGDVAKGSKLFFEKTELSCLRCHKVDRAGGEVGPNLTVIGKTRDRRYLLESICLPDAKIAEGFETAVIANDSGQVFSGIVKSENDDYVELIQNDGSQVKVFTDEVVARRKGKSSMPDDLTKYMTARDLRDLVAYLASLQVDPRAATDVE